MTKIHFIAIGGAAMHNLALAVASKAGYRVTGSDDEIFDPALSHLREAGLLPEEMGWHPERITSDIDAIILGMHAREDNPELIRARELGLKIYSFPEYLYEQTKDKIRIVTLVWIWVLPSRWQRVLQMPVSGLLLPSSVTRRLRIQV